MLVGCRSPGRERNCAALPGLGSGVLSDNCFSRLPVTLIAFLENPEGAGWRSPSNRSKYSWQSEQKDRIRRRPPRRQGYPDARGGGWRRVHKSGHRHHRTGGRVRTSSPTVSGSKKHTLQARGPDILRSKGILDFKGEAERYVFQGVHMLMGGTPIGPWPDDAQRIARLVFIGRDPESMGLEEGSAACRVTCDV